MKEKDVYIGGTSIQIGEHGFINQPKEIIEYIKYLQNQLQQKENIIKEVITYIEWLRNEHHKTENLGYTKAVYNTNELLVILHKLRGE